VSATWPAARGGGHALLLELPGLGFTDAFFETMSGVSTTGATVLVAWAAAAPAGLWRMRSVARAWA
jgi:trk system potassium uptake protein TrkH